MSVRLSTGWPRACSGTHVCGRPEDRPVDRVVARHRRRRREIGASASPATAFARPKSRTFTVPSVVILMFAGFRSRWTIPRSCAKSSARAIWRATPSASRAESGPRREPVGERVAVDQLEDQKLDCSASSNP